MFNYYIIYMKKICFVVFLFLFASNVFANNIAVVDVNKIVSGSTAFKKLNQSLEKEKNSYQDKIKQREIELNAKKDDLQSKSAILSQENLQKQALEFQKEILSFQEEIKAKEVDLQKKLAYGIEVLNEEVQQIVNDIVKESDNKYDVVLNSNVLLYSNDKNDITLEVLKRLNKKNINLIKK